MSSVSIQGNASGTGIFTIASPNSNTNRTLTLPDATGTIITTAGGAAISGTTGAFTSTVGVGGATPAASGAGITFPATQSASTDANTLDDYEEGTWSPVVSDGTNNGTMDGAQTGGTYVKIGNQISINGNLYMTAKGSLSGSLRITGLPFTMTNSVVRRTGGVFGYASDLNVTAGQTAVFYTQQNSTYINLTLYDTTGGVTNLQASEVNANLYLVFGFTINL